MMSTQTALLIAIAAFGLGLSGCSNGTGDAAAEPAEAASGKVQSAVSDITVAQAKNLIGSEPAVVVLDVRTPEEFAQGHIENAVNIDFQADDFAEELAKLDRDQRYIVHCRSGRRSSASMEVFEDLGFSDIQHMFEGMNGWQAAQLPVVM